ncbi:MULTISPECIES: GGDEF domain-containing protein [Tsukamurella]|nr:MULTISPECIES: GGDEF domain-containing protein [Tsukamurella]NKY17438.1 GGDEF domain-containing protein [Tsukamurella spumae]
MSSAGIRAVFDSGASVHADKYDVLRRVGLHRVAVNLAALCVAGIAVTAILLALSGRSTIPALCVALAVPAVGWAWFLHRTPRMRYAQSLGFLAYCDVVIIVGLFVVTDSEVGFLKLTWLVAVSGYAYGFHGRVAMALQSAIGVVGLGVVIAMALIHHDSSIPLLAAGSVTVVVINAATALVIDGGIRRFGLTAERAEHLARLDDLTGLLNRRGLGHACRGWSGAMTVAVLDLDGFKRLNDTHGHPAGDEVLRHVARGLRAAAGPSALVARLGGDEFAVVAGRLPDLEAGIRGTFDGVPVRASLGLAHGIADGAAGLDALLASADAAMYRAKRAADRRTA